MDEGKLEELLGGKVPNLLDYLVDIDGYVLRWRSGGGRSVSTGESRHAALRQAPQHGFGKA